MFGTPYSGNSTTYNSQAPNKFKDSARNAIFQQLPSVATTGSGSTSIRSAPSRFQDHKHSSNFRSVSSSIFSGKRSVRSAPSIYSSSTATIPEDSEPISTTVEQLVNDISLHEKYYLEQQSRKSAVPEREVSNQSEHKISLGSDLQYQNVPESLVDWNLNVTRCKLIVTQLPMLSSVPDLIYSQSELPQLVGDLVKMCHIILIQPHITDKELIHTFVSSNIYEEHGLDKHFKRSVAEISVKQSRLLQISSPQKKDLQAPINYDGQYGLEFQYKEIAMRNYLINLAAAATTAHEYKQKSNALKKELRQGENKKAKLSKEQKKVLWDQVRSDVFRRAGLEEN